MNKLHSMNLNQPQWYAVQTLTNKEAKVKQYIEKFAVIEGVTAWIFEVLMPTETVAEVRGGKKRSRVRKFYPGYVFINVILYGEDGKILQQVWDYIRKIDGVIGFVGGDRPVPLKEKDVEQIKSQAAQAEGREVPKVQYEVGEMVKIIDGPFLNLSGKIEDIDIERGKLKVSVSLFGRYTPVELEYWQVERDLNSDKE